MRLAERLAWLLELAPPVEALPVRCPAYGPLDAARCASLQDEGKVRACAGCDEGVLPPRVRATREAAPPRSAGP